MVSQVPTRGRGGAPPTPDRKAARIPRESGEATPPGPTDAPGPEDQRCARGPKKSRGRARKAQGRAERYRGRSQAGLRFPDLGACASPGKGIGFRQPPGSSDVQSPGVRRVSPDWTGSPPPIVPLVSILGELEPLPEGGMMLT